MFTHLLFALFSGTYLMVIREEEATPGWPVIKVVKVQDLSADPVAKLMWRQEVLDLHTHALQCFIHIDQILY